MATIFSAPAEEEPGSALKPEIHGKVEFKHVCFGYDRFDDVLSDISFTANPGETIAILGSTGSGKTTLTEMLTERYGAKAYYEQSDNPYIGDFYNDMNRWSFNLQMYFLGSRIQQTMDILRSGPVDIFQDRTVYEDAYIFADNLHRMGLMSGRDFDTYMSIFGLITNLVPRPDLLIYLKASVPTLISQIRRRGRAYEMNIDEQYLRRLNYRYDDWIEHIYRGEVLVIDKDREDFVADAAVMEKICARLDRKREELETAKK